MSELNDKERIDAKPDFVSKRPFYYSWESLKE